MNRDERKFVIQSTIKSLGALASSYLPFLAPFVSIYGDVLSDREFSRLKEMLDSLKNEFDAHQAEINMVYIKRDDFQEIFEDVVKRATQERSELKRLAYKNILLNTVLRQDPDFDRIDSNIRLLDQLTPDHIAVLRLIYRPEIALKEGSPVDPSLIFNTNHALFSSFLQWHDVERIRDVLFDLEFMRLIEPLAGGMNSMSRVNISSLQNARTKKGEALVSYIMKD